MEDWGYWEVQLEHSDLITLATERADFFTLEKNPDRTYTVYETEPCVY